MQKKNIFEVSIKILGIIFFFMFLEKIIYLPFNVILLSEWGEDILFYIVLIGDAALYLTASMVLMYKASSITNSLIIFSLPLIEDSENQKFKTDLLTFATRIIGIYIAIRGFVSLIGLSNRFDYIVKPLEWNFTIAAILHSFILLVLGIIFIRFSRLAPKN